MANQVEMAKDVAIRALLELGWPQRLIARELGVDRETVARRAAGAARLSKPAKVPTGSGPPGAAVEADSRSGGTGPKPASAASEVPTGSGVVDVPTGVAGPSRSACEPHRELILAMLTRGLSAQRIWQDLGREHDIEVGHDSVKRFVRRLGRSTPLPFRRIECEPGAEAQFDFGRGAPIVGADGRRRRSWVFRIVLSHSRKGYTEATFRQTTDDLIRCLEHAFHHFGGVPATLVLDNAKSAVHRAEWCDPDLNPRLAAFCAHDGTVLLPTKPRTPRHNGKVENSVGYVKGNALKGHVFASLAAENEHLGHWEHTVADTRIHGTTRRQVKQAFEELERPALRPLPGERFPFFEEATRIVHRDGHVEVAKSYYPVPAEYVGRTVWARWDARLVRIFDHRFQPIAVHVRVEPGRFSRDPQFLHPHKVSAVERGAGHLLQSTRFIGLHTHRWAKAMLDDRGIEGVRVLIGLHALAKKHTTAVLEQACEIAHSHGAYRLRALRELIRRGGPKQDQFQFMECHPIIRTLGEYTEAARRAIHRSAAASGGASAAITGAVPSS
jgi:transposase